MNLKDFLAKRDNPPELFWSIVIEEQQAQSGIWHIEENSSVVDAIGTQSSYFNKEELITAVDSTLSSAMQKLPDDSLEPKKTVFGVASSWVSGGEIKDEHLENIKTICDELELSAVGFVVLSEAVAHLYKSEEGVPLSAIVIGMGVNTLEISVFKLGNLIGNTTVQRSVSISDDVIEGLSRFEGATPLPSRFVVYDGKEGDLDTAKEELMKSTWDDQEKVKFLHTPKAEILEPDRKILAVSLAGASEMVVGISKVSLRQMSEIPEEVQNVEPAIPIAGLGDLGFAVNEDVTEVTPKSSVKPVELPKKQNVLHNLKMPHMPNLPSLPKMPKINFSVGPIAGIFITILIILGLIFYFVPKVDISIAVTPKSFESKFETTFDSGNSEVLSITKSGTKTKSATGKKVIGDKAKGTVEIANGNASPIKLTSGTILTSSSGLKFATVSEASISGQLLPGSPGTAQIDVLSDSIGSQYNLGKGEVFTVGNYAKSLVAGTSQNDFSGGSSREISAVSKEDHDSLLSDLNEELTLGAKDELVEKIDSGKMVIADYSEINVKSEKFDHKVNDEADNLKLDLEVEVKVVVVDKNKLFEFTKEKLGDIAPAGFILRNDQISYKFDHVDNEDGKYTFNTSVKANYLPSVNIDDLKKQIKGKTITATKSYLKSVAGFKGAQIKFNNNIFASFNVLPFIEKNITIEIGA